MKRQRVLAPAPDCEKKGFQGEEPEDRHFYNGSKKCKPCSRLLWFEPESVPKNFAAVIYGQRRTGKTTWLRWLLHQYQHDYDRVCCFSSTNFKVHPFFFSVRSPPS